MSLSISRPLLDAAAVERLLHAGLANAAAATVLAALVALLCRLGPVRRRPAVVHGLWLLVLLKLLAPPMWSVSIHAPVAFASKSAEAAPAVAQLMELPIAEESEAAWQDNVRAADAAPAEPTDQAEPQDATAPAAPAPTAVSAPEGVRRWVERFHVAAPAAAVAWAAGTLGCLAVAAVRIVRFRRVLRHASVAPREVQGRAAALSAEMGLRPSACPGVWFVPGAVSPMLWALPYWLGGPRGPRLLLPAALWEQLDHRQRDTILLHELAHLRRRDHWVRLLELAVTALWWWHPVAWWARRRLREAEEQCCDAWVVWARPASVRDYATALLEALEFAAASIFPSDPSGNHKKTPALPAVPALASGMAEFHELKRRLVMIKQGTSTGRLRKLSWTGLSAFCGMAALLLPLMPTVAVAQEAREKQDDSAPAVDTADGAQAEADGGSGSAREAAETHEAEEPAKHPHGVTDYTAGGSADDKVRWKAAASASEAANEVTHSNLRVHERLSSELARARAEVERARAQLSKAEHELAALQAHASVARLGPREWVKTAPPQLSLAPPTHPKTATVPVKPAAKGAASDGDREARLRKLEDNLGMLLQEVKALRDERPSSARFDGNKKDDPLGQPEEKPQERGRELKRLSR